MVSPRVRRHGEDVLRTALKAVGTWPSIVATLLLVAHAPLSPTCLSAQTIYGVLMERGSDRGIDLGLVTLLTLEGDSVMTVLTDSVGQFRIASPEPGDFLLAASALGYEPTVARSVVTLARDVAVTLEFRIAPLAIEIGGITVEVRSALMRQPRLVRNGFVERARQGFGSFITPGEIAKSGAIRVGDLLAQTGQVTNRYSIRGDRTVMRGRRGYCTPAVYLDGVRHSLSGVSLDDLVRVSSLEAVEIYRSATQAPVRFGGGMEGCGVIVLWTRAR